MAVTCKNCGGAHAIWECKRPAKKSTAPKIEILGHDNVGSAQPTLSSAGEPMKNSGQAYKTPADDAPPVDTTSTRVAHKGSAAASAEGVSSILTPGAKFDKKAWSRAYMKIWMRNKRAKLKLERENAK